MSASRVALVSGGARRLGRQIAVDLAAAGYDVAINYYSATQEEVDETTETIRRRGARSLALRADISNPQEVDHLIAEAEQTLGPIDLFVANAGAFRRTPLASVTELDWQEMLRLNLDVFRIPARTIGLAMKKRGSGCIIAIADVAALRPWADYMPYSVAKAGVATLVHTLAVALGPEVRVNAVAPGPILFPADQDEAAYLREIGKTVLQRAGRAENISDAVIFLSANDYITGVILPVDGGRLLK